MTRAVLFMDSQFDQIRVYYHHMVPAIDAAAWADLQEADSRRSCFPRVAYCCVMEISAAMSPLSIRGCYGIIICRRGVKCVQVSG